MIQLSMEVPTFYLAEWSPLCDLDFVLAHRILEDEKYAGFFAGRLKGRQLIMDNSMHELGHPLPITDLQKAADLIHADVVIPPDRLGEAENNMSWFSETANLLSDTYRIGGVMCGRTAGERLVYAHHIKNSDVLFLPYRVERLQWFLEQERFIVRNWSWIHLLGVSELSELRRWVEISKMYAGLRWSIDTGKAIKWGISERPIESLSSLRANPLSSKDLLGVGKLSTAQERMIRQNILFLRTLCA